MASGCASPFNEGDRSEADASRPSLLCLGSHSQQESAVISHHMVYSQQRHPVHSFAGQPLPDIHLLDFPRANLSCRHRSCRRWVGSSTLNRGPITLGHTDARSQRSRQGCPSAFLRAVVLGAVCRRVKSWMYGPALPDISYS